MGWFLVVEWLHRKILLEIIHRLRKCAEHSLTVSPSFLFFSFLFFSFLFFSFHIPSWSRDAIHTYIALPCLVLDGWMDG